MFFTYIIYSPSLNRYYTGHCQDLEERLRRHNQGNGATYTKKAKDWQLQYTKCFETRAEAAKFELTIKRKKSRRYIEWLISKDETG
ncbi:MAG: GIY-YIG nuclease family protein [Bacteroidota bacterium]